MFLAGAWLAVIVNEAAPPWLIVVVLPVNVSIGTTDEVIVTDVLDGVPIW